MLDSNHGRRMHINVLEHPGTSSPCQTFQARRKRGTARAVVSAACGSADFLYPTASPHSYPGIRAAQKIVPMPDAAGRMIREPIPNHVHKKQDLGQMVGLTREHAGAQLAAVLESC